MTNSLKLVITSGELDAIEKAAACYPSKDGRMSPRIICCFIKHMEDTYGIDLGIETEDMNNERSKRHSKEGHRSLKLGRKQSDGDADDF